MVNPFPAAQAPNAPESFDDLVRIEKQIRVKSGQVEDQSRQGAQRYGEKPHGGYICSQQESGAQRRTSDTHGRKPQLSKNKDVVGTNIDSKAQADAIRGT